MCLPFSSCCTIGSVKAAIVLLLYAGLRSRPKPYHRDSPSARGAPSVAIDLPLKALVAEDANGEVSLSYKDPEYLRELHGFPADAIKNLAGAGVLIAKAVE
jgi:hypothetical protein